LASYGEGALREIDLAEGIQQTLNRIWCSDCGMVCKEMGDNFFLFHFNHLASDNRALEDGPWMVGHSVLVKYDGKHTLEAMEFNHIPIDIFVSGLPIAMMNKEAAEIIGEEMDQFLDVDADENGTMTWCYLRLKVQMDIRQPHLQGITIEIKDEGKDKRWCWSTSSSWNSSTPVRSWGI
jgi:hypothetical protein